MGSALLLHPVTQDQVRGRTTPVGSPSLRPERWVAHPSRAPLVPRQTRPITSVHLSSARGCQIAFLPVSGTWDPLAGHEGIGQVASEACWTPNPSRDTTQVPVVPGRLLPRAHRCGQEVRAEVGPELRPRAGTGAASRRADAWASWVAAGDGEAASRRPTPAPRRQPQVPLWWWWWPWTSLLSRSLSFPRGCQTGH